MVLIFILFLTMDRLSRCAYLLFVLAALARSNFPTHNIENVNVIRNVTARSTQSSQENCININRVQRLSQDMRECVLCMIQAGRAVIFVRLVQNYFRVWYILRVFWGFFNFNFFYSTLWRSSVIYGQHSCAFLLFGLRFLFPLFFDPENTSVREVCIRRIL